MLKFLYRYWPFTLNGSLLFGIAFSLLGYSYANQNSYGYLIGGGTLLFLVSLVILVRIQNKLVKGEIEWDISEPVVATRRSEFTFMFPNTSLFPFFRMQVSFRGKILIQGRGIMSFYREARSAINKLNQNVRFPITFPVPGLLSGRADFTIQDAFGFCRGLVDKRLHCEKKVIPHTFPRNESVKSSVSGAETSMKKISDDSEKTQTRDYIPGDRLRDISWKSLSKGGAMVTKISPVSEETTTVVNIYPRFIARGNDTLESLAHLSFLKSWIASFAKDIMKSEDKRYRIALFLGDEPLYIEGESELPILLEKIAVCGYTGSQSALPNLAECGTVYLFTTPFDPAYENVRQSYQNTDFRIMTTAFPAERGETVKFSYIGSKESFFVPYSRHLFFRRQRRSAVNSQINESFESIPIEVSLFP